uniref:Uncharacterized protein n=1 Tax=Arundo donax TaxID=35708 RepID=A0A0A9FAT6_ARUDO
MDNILSSSHPASPSCLFIGCIPVLTITTSYP